MYDKLYERHRFTFMVLFGIATLGYLGFGFAAFTVLLLGLLGALLLENMGVVYVSVSIGLLLLAIAVGSEPFYQDMEYTFWRNQ